MSLVDVPTLAESLAARETANSAAPPEVYDRTQELLTRLTNELPFQVRAAVSAQVITRMFTYRSAFGITAEQFQGIPRSMRRFLPVERRLVQRTRKDTDGTKLALVDTIRLYEDHAAASAAGAMMMAGYAGQPVAADITKFLEGYALAKRALYLG